MKNAKNQRTVGIRTGTYAIALILRDHGILLLRESKVQIHQIFLGKKVKTIEKKSLNVSDLSITDK